MASSVSPPGKAGIDRLERNRSRFIAEAVLLELKRSIDKQRIRRRYGCISAAELEAIDSGLCLYLGLEPAV